jgi:hypothetical protein
VQLAVPCGLDHLPDELLQQIIKNAMNNKCRRKHSGQSLTPPVRIVPRPPPQPALTDEAADQIQQLLRDWLL